MNIRSLAKGMKFCGEASGKRQTYYVFESGKGYVVMSASRTKRASGYFNLLYGGKKSCTVAGCKRGYRAKGFCSYHYSKWRRGEMKDRPPRFGTCSKEGCKKKVVGHGLCQEHL